MPDSWDPEEVLDIHPLYGGLFTCVGITQQGRRCRNSFIKREYLQRAQQILDYDFPELNQCRAVEDALRDKLEHLAWLTLCPRWHQSRIPQAGIIAAKWLDAILALERSTLSRSSHSITTSSTNTLRGDSSSGSSSSGGGGGGLSNGPQSIRSSILQGTSSLALSNGSRTARSTTSSNSVSASNASHTEGRTSLGASGSSSAILSNGLRTTRNTTSAESSSSSSSASSQARQHWANLQPATRSTQPGPSNEARRFPRPPPSQSSTDLETTIISRQMQRSATPSPSGSSTTLSSRSHHQNHPETPTPAPRDETQSRTSAEPRDSTPVDPAGVPEPTEPRTPPAVSPGSMIAISRNSPNAIQINLNITIVGHRGYTRSGTESPQTPTRLDRHIRRPITPLSPGQSNRAYPLSEDTPHPHREVRSSSSRPIDPYANNPSIAEVIEALDSFVSRLSARSMLPSPSTTSRSSRHSTSPQSRSLSIGPRIDSPVVEYTSSSGFSTPGQFTPPESPFGSPLVIYSPSSSGSPGSVSAQPSQRTNSD